MLKELLPEKKHDRKLRESLGKLDVVKRNLIRNIRLHLSIVIPSGCGDEYVQ